MSEKKFEDRQRQSMADFRRSAFRHEPLIDMRDPDISALVHCVDTGDVRGANLCAEIIKKRQQAEAIRQMNADMADLIEFAKAGEFRESEG